jgi:DNA-directed RNA polymerase specialized sigma24 family protein
MSDLNQKLDDLFRKESSRLIIVLTRIFGPHNVDMAEDVVQSAFMKTFVHLKKIGGPGNPAGV